MKTALKVWSWTIGLPFIIIGAAAAAVAAPAFAGLKTGAQVVGEMLGDAFTKERES